MVPRLHRPGQPAGWRTPTTRSTASRRRPIRGFPAAAATRSTGLYDVIPAKFGQISNLVIDSKGYGDWYQYFNGVDVTLNVRLSGGFTVQGGTSTGKQIADNCAVRANLPELDVNLTPGLPA